MSSRLFPERAQLRRELRARRRSLSPAQQAAATRALAQRLATLPSLRRARHIALYWPMDGEIDPRLLARCGHFRGHRFYLPVLQAFPANTLRFAPWRAGDRLARNRFGIPEPRGQATVAARDLDAVLMPLTGFDARGNRLGMGGGFYDRTLAFHRRRRQRPLLVGVAHACQQLPALAVAAWDVPLPLVATDRHLLRPRAAPRPFA
jgi:5-formyltetrahydrofolate cyclo-ligase